ncbi:hypothetical protein HXX76_001440 [Chlamydomonas incerta]|uniref:separase n=1 Tax=Chlamydomonas incerta TaxID=51695 RepID=A0A836B197_CHLIN|nr:hypothetical protein HXX76_001440 [Chlamydomonas incerta]|eukprot:KAG2444696.1 hypothetical protein HXX76_001440 [Chlamydomonas incerta]
MPAASDSLAALATVEESSDASGHELDTQRYGFIRKLAALGLHERALEQGRVLHAAVAAHPSDAGTPADLHIAAVANLLLCYGELAQREPDRSEELWQCIGTAVDGLLDLARDASDKEDCAKRLEPVLRCLGKAVGALLSANLAAHLAPGTAAAQLAALAACGDLSGQEQAVKQLLVEDAAGAAEEARASLLEALLVQLEKQAPAERQKQQHPLAAALAGMPTAARALAAEQEQSSEERWLRWCCLDVLRVSAAGVLAHLLNNPQRAGGNLPAVAECMKALAADSLRLLHQSPGKASTVVPSGCSAATLACRLAAAHRMSTGQLAGLHEDVAAGAKLLRGLLSAASQQQQEQHVDDEERDGPCCVTVDVLAPGLLQSLSASMGNAGLDLLQAQHVAPAAELLQLSAELALRRAQALYGAAADTVAAAADPATAAAAAADVAAVVKKCKAHVSALHQVSDLDGAMAAAAAYLAQLHGLCEPHVALPLVKLYVRASLTRAHSAAAAAHTAGGSSAAEQAHSAPSTPTAPAAPGPAAPCKARRGGRARAQADVQPKAAAKAPRGRTRLALDADMDTDAGGDELVESVIPQRAAGAPPALTAATSLSVVQAMASAVESGAAPAGLLGCLDMYAALELELAAEECRRMGDARLQQVHADAVVGALFRCAEQRGAGTALLRARALLLRALLSSPDGAAAVAQADRDLQEACGLLDEQLGAQGLGHFAAGPSSGDDSDDDTQEQEDGQALSADVFGLLDSAALAHAQLGLRLAQKLMAKSQACDEAMEHVGMAARLWARVLACQACTSAMRQLRMPQAALQALLQAHHLTHLLAGSFPHEASQLRSVTPRLVAWLAKQVKLREPHAYLLLTALPDSTCATWAMAAAPGASLAEVAAAAAAEAEAPSAKLGELLELMQLMRAAPLLDHSALGSAAAACAAELERGSFLRHGPAPLLLRCRFHQSAAAAYLRAGDTANAYVQAQEALRLTCGLFALLDAPEVSPDSAAPSHAASAAGRGVGGGTGAAEPTPAEAAAAAVQSGAATSAQDYTVRDEEDEPQDEFGDLGRRPHQQQQEEEASGDRQRGLEKTDGSKQSVLGVSAGLGWAIAAAHLAALHQAARVFEASGCVEDAMCLWRECARAAAAFGVRPLQALACCCLADVACRRADAASAEASLQEAEDAVARSCSPADADGAGHGAVAAEAALVRADLCAAQARCCLLKGAADKAQAAAARGAGALGGVAGGALGWLAASAQSRLARLRAAGQLKLGQAAGASETTRDAVAHLQAAACAAGADAAAEGAEAGSAGPEVLWPVDYGLLLAQQAGAGGASGAGQHGGAPWVVGLSGPGAGPAAAGTPDAEAGSEASDGKQKTDQGSKRASARAKAGAASAKAAKATGAVGGAAVSGAQASTPHVASLLLALRLCWQVPLAATHAARQLLRLAVALGLPHAAALSMHLANCASYPQQQLMQEHMRRYLPRTAATAGAAITAQDEEEAGGESDEDEERCGSGTSASSSGGCQAAGDVSAAALRLVSELCGSGRAAACAGGDTAAALERGAEAWVRQVLECLPADCVIASVMEEPEDQTVLLGRLSRGGPPVLVMLPGTPQSGSPGGGDNCLRACLGQLQRLLEDSGDSMRTDQTAASAQSHKAQWWKARTALDASVSKLLQQLDSGCLGAWRCLLLPLPAGHREVLAGAAAAFTAEHVTGGAAGAATASAVAQELLVVAMANMGQLGSQDVGTVLRAVCAGVGGGKGGSADVAALATELAAAEAAARVALLQLPRLASGPTASPEPAPAKPAPAAAAEPAELAPAPSRARRPAAATAPAATASSSARAVPGARARPALAARPIATEAARRTAAAAPACLAASLEALTVDDAAPSMTSAAPAVAADQPVRGRRAPRMAAMQSESAASAAAKAPPVRGLVAASKAGARTARAAPASAATGAATARTASLSEARASAAASQEAQQGTVVTSGASAAGSCPLLLVLSPCLHALPWESMPCLRGRSVSRAMSLPAACSAAAAASSGGGGSRPAGALSSAFYLLNPSADLADTQRAFQPLLEAQPGWQGVVGQQPGARALLAALAAHELFLFLGHGSGEQFLPLPALRKLQRCAAAVLMGCSSGRLRLHGAYDPAGAVVAYTLAGSPAVVANLWDVTDRDIDRYCQALLRTWLGFADPAGAEAAAAAAGGEEEAPPVGWAGLGQAVAGSRGACRLPHLIGAAPVCYGLPLRQ